MSGSGTHLNGLKSQWPKISTWLLIGGLLFAPLTAWAAKTYTYQSHGYYFDYPSDWSVKKNTLSVSLRPPSAKLKTLKRQGVTYTAGAQQLNKDSRQWTVPLRVALKKNWTTFTRTYAAKTAKQYGATATVKRYTKSGWTAAEVVLVKRGSPTTTWRIFLLTKDKKNVYAVTEKWTGRAASPFNANIKSVVSSLALTTSYVAWDFNGTKWKPTRSAPACPDAMTIRLPIDITQASSVLYPGQVRGGQYKPHGGFRLDGTAYNAVTITAPMDAYVVDGSQHYEGADIQYYFDFVSPCGFRYRLDHLHTLSPTLAALAEQLPAAGVGSEAHFVTPKFIKAGTVIATAVGHPDNVGFDLGLYDLRKRNAASASPAFQSAHSDMIGNAFFAVCWFDWLSAADEAAVRALPPGDGISGATSDFCS